MLNYTLLFCQNSQSFEALQKHNHYHHLFIYLLFSQLKVPRSLEENSRVVYFIPQLASITLNL